MPDYLYCLKYTFWRAEHSNCICMTHNTDLIYQEFGEFMRDFDWDGSRCIDEVFMETWKSEDSKLLHCGQYKLESTESLYKQK